MTENLNVHISLFAPPSQCRCSARRVTTPLTLFHPCSWIAAVTPVASADLTGTRSARNIKLYFYKPDLSEYTHKNQDPSIYFWRCVFSTAVMLSTKSLNALSCLHWLPISRPFFCCKSQNPLNLLKAKLSLAAEKVAFKSLCNLHSVSQSTLVRAVFIKLGSGSTALPWLILLLLTHLRWCADLL